MKNKKEIKEIKELASKSKSLLEEIRDALKNNK